MIGTTASTSALTRSQINVYLSPFNLHADDPAIKDLKALKIDVGEVDHRQAR